MVVAEGGPLRELQVGLAVEKRRRVMAAREMAAREMAACEAGCGGWGRRLRMKLRHDIQRGAYCGSQRRDQLKL